MTESFPDEGPCLGNVCLQPLNQNFLHLSILKKKPTVLKLGTIPFKTYFFMVQITHLLNL